MYCSIVCFSIVWAISTVINMTNESFKNGGAVDFAMNWFREKYTQKEHPNKLCMQTL